ncbi:MAG: cation diffusion facilitator family transporter [Methanosarcina barkeri]|nr:cation diffusion facilitator family transporter [Methanosarcina sp. ERenArc_MAG2]
MEDTGYIDKYTLFNYGESEDTRYSRAAHVTKVSMILNFLLTAFKFAAGILGNSSAMIADAAHSLSDFITDIAVIVGLKIARKPRDSTHNYGHGKIETLAAAFIGLVLVAAAFGIFWGVFRKLLLFIMERTSGAKQNRSCCSNLFNCGKRVAVPLHHSMWPRTQE